MAKGSCYANITYICQWKKVESESIRHSVVSDSLPHYGLSPTRLLCPWNYPGKNTGVGSHSLLQEIFPTQGSNTCLLHCQAGSLPLGHQYQHQFSRSVMSDSLWPHGLQHSRLPWPSPTPGGCSNHWIGDAIQPSHPLSSPSPPAFNLSQHKGLFQWVISSHQVASVKLRDDNSE